LAAPKTAQGHNNRNSDQSQHSFANVVIIATYLPYSENMSMMITLYTAVTFTFCLVTSLFILENYVIIIVSIIGFWTEGNFLSTRQTDGL
jgi:hypothetical protein